MQKVEAVNFRQDQVLGREPLPGWRANRKLYRVRRPVRL